MMTGTRTLVGARVPVIFSPNIDIYYHKNYGCKELSAKYGKFFAALIEFILIIMERF